MDIYRIKPYKINKITKKYAEMETLLTKKLENDILET